MLIHLLRHKTNSGSVCVTSAFWLCQAYKTLQASILHPFSIYTTYPCRAVGYTLYRPQSHIKRSSTIHTLTFTHCRRFIVTIHLVCMCLDCRRKLENLERTRTDTWRTCTLHPEWARSRTQKLLARRQQWQRPFADPRFTKFFFIFFHWQWSWQQ